MASLLDRKIRDSVAKAFKGKLTKGQLRREVSGGVDGAGDATSPTVTTFALQGIREDFSAYYKANANIPETDVSILVIQGLLRPATSITKADEDNMIFLGTPWNTWHKIRKLLTIDPANASVKLQCYEVPAP